MPSTPEQGDVIVQRDQQHGGPLYVLHTAHGPAQLAFRSRGDAVRHAASIAMRTRVRVWLDVGARFELLEDFRAADALGERHE